MSQVIEWRFAGTPTIYQTQATKFDTTVTKLRNSMNIHVDHEIIIENEHTTTQPDVQSVEHSPVSDSDQHVDQPATVSKPSKAVTAVDETPELSDLPGDLEFTDAEPTVL
jgi:hypothetical protein